MAVFDKTGTLTLGRPRPVGLETLSHAQASVALALARNSRHPLSEGLRRALEATDTMAADVTDITETPGVGLAGSWQGRNVSLGRSDSDSSGLATTLAIKGQTPVTLHFEDALRPDAAAIIARLSTLGLPATILSGDRASAVAPVATALGLSARADMQPAEKYAAVTALGAEGRRVLMVGDGLNDGPALAAGHVSIAPASASDASQNVADAVFLGDSLSPVADAVRVARATRARVRENFALAIGYNLIAVPLAIAGVVTPLIAALAMSGSSIIVVANALRLRGSAK
jgi:Cu2+-exporting ATPase